MTEAVIGYSVLAVFILVVLYVQYKRGVEEDRALCNEFVVGKLYHSTLHHCSLRVNTINYDTREIEFYICDPKLSMCERFDIADVCEFAQWTGVRDDNINRN